MFTMFNANTDQAAGDTVHFRIKLGVAPALVLKAQRFAFTIEVRRLGRQVAKSLFWDPIPHVASIAFEVLFTKLC